MVSLSNLTESVLKERGIDTPYKNQIVTSLIIAGVGNFVKDKDVSRVKEKIVARATSLTSTPNPLKVCASFNEPKNNICNYCKKPMKQLKIGGDNISEALCCLEDRIVMPLKSGSIL